MHEKKNKKQFTERHCLLMAQLVIRGCSCSFVPLREKKCIMALHKSERQMFSMRAVRFRTNLICQNLNGNENNCSATTHNNTTNKKRAHSGTHKF